MKKIVFFSVLMALMLSSWAQLSPNYTISGQTSKSFDICTGASAKFVAEENGNLLLTTRTTKNLLVARVPDDIMVRWVDKSLNVQQEYVLQNSRQYELLATNVADGEVVLLVKYWEKKQLIVKRIVLDKAALQAKSEEVIYSHDAPNDDLTICWATVSENGDFAALLVLAVDQKEAVESRMFLLDDHFAKLWDREPAMKACYGLWVNNEGDIYMANVADDKVLFAKLTEDDNYQYFAEVPSRVGTLRLLNVVDECMVVGGTYVYDENRESDYVKGYFGMSYDMKRGRLVGAEFKALTPDDVRVIQNWTARTRDREFSAILSVVSRTATSYGGAMALANISHTIINSQNGGVTEYYTQGGLLTFGVNVNGEVAWSYPIRHFEKAANTLVFSQPMVADGDKVFLFHSEDSKASPEYSIEKVQKQKNALGMTNDLVMYSFDEKGMTGKAVVAPKQKGILSGESQHWFDDHYYLIYTGNKKSGLMIINSQN